VSSRAPVLAANLRTRLQLLFPTWVLLLSATILFTAQAEREPARSPGEDG
jgi:hypothetical protein